MKKILDHIFLMRPLLLLPIWAPFLLGYYRSGGSWDYSLLLPFFMITSLGAGVFVLNQIFDVESDRFNKKLFILPEGYISLKAAWIQVIILDVIAITLGFILRSGIGIGAIIGVLFGILYSVPPLSVKNRGMVALLLNGLGHGSLIFLLGWMTGARFSLTALMLSIPYFLAFAGVYIATTIPDAQGDKTTGKNTLAVLWGPKLSGVMVILLIILATLVGYFVWEIEIYLTGVIGILLYTASLFAGIKLYLITNKIIVLTFTIVTAYVFKPYFIVALSVIFITLLYNKIRLKISIF